ncbi:M56 family metallopeptidase [Paludisphaera mucosa]|uniref:M56 family metallopeptidase n=1 Tax=Paludisphaera mucosa TaxID=3030827 RepID=A0ABT6FD62_9BACT|nr:M56 family metallopeptidase [Paludisphaera mucosa]MDG3005290.1 M56 family metallopeptidase [Paludisphaera mucosa]
MDWPIFDGGRLANAAGGGLVVLVLGSLAVRLSRQPVHRARLVVLTLLGAAAIPGLAALPFTPRWSLGLLPASAVAPPVERKTAAPIAARLHDETVHEGPVERPSPKARSVQGSAAPPAPRRASWREVAPSFGVMAAGAYIVAAAGWAGWWWLGQFALWRIARAARPAPRAARDVLIDLAGPAGERVRLLESDRIALPFTYTWLRPVILLPASLCDGREGRALRYALAHEWSHVERRDAWGWNLAGLAGLVLFYQPLFWWLRRQLRLCQDYLADARAAAAGSAEDYAAFLLHLARIHEAGPSRAALGIGDRRSSLYRRVVMLIQDREPLEPRCRAAWSLAAVATSAVVVLAASGLRLDAAPAPKEAAAQDAPKPPEAAKPAGETLNYKGIVKDKDTGKPIAGAAVVVRRSIYRDDVYRILQETRHTTAADGTFAFTIPPEQAAERALYVQLDVEHPDYATRTGFGKALAIIRKDEGFGVRPFFERIELDPAQPITGRVETPEGTPAAGVEVHAYSRVDKHPWGMYAPGSFAHTRTDVDGAFRLPITTPGPGVFWILPKTYAPQMHVLADGRRGDLGTFRLKPGASLTGRVVDLQGTPLARLLIAARREQESGPDADALNQMNVADKIRSTTETDAEGRFVFNHLPPGEYQVAPTAIDIRVDPSERRGRKLPGVFLPRKVSIAEDATPPVLEIRESPHVVVEGRWLDSQGRPRSGWSSTLFGQIGGESWFARTNPDSQGIFSLMVPRGLRLAKVDTLAGEYTSMRRRIGKEAPLAVGEIADLGTLDHDVKDFDIVRYDAPVILINATTREGRQIEGFQADVQYHALDLEGDPAVRVLGGRRQADSLRREINDGRYRTLQMLPDREVLVSVRADGYVSASRTMKLAEGQTEEATFVLEPR